MRETGIVSIRCVSNARTLSLAHFQAVKHDRDVLGYFLALTKNAVRGVVAAAEGPSAAGRRMVTGLAFGKIRHGMWLLFVFGGAG